MKDLLDLGAGAFLVGGAIVALIVHIRNADQCMKDGNVVVFPMSRYQHCETIRDDNRASKDQATTSFGRLRSAVPE